MEETVTGKIYMHHMFTEHKMLALDSMNSEEDIKSRGGKLKGAALDKDCKPILDESGEMLVVVRPLEDQIVYKVLSSGDALNKAAFRQTVDRAFDQIKTAIKTKDYHYRQDQRRRKIEMEFLKLLMAVYIVFCLWAKYEQVEVYRNGYKEGSHRTTVEIIDYLDSLKTAKH